MQGGACQSEREVTGTKERVQEMVQETKRSGWAPGEEGGEGLAAQSALCAFEGSECWERLASHPFKGLSRCRPAHARCACHGHAGRLSALIS